MEMKTTRDRLLHVRVNRIEHATAKVVADHYGVTLSQAFRMCVKWHAEQIKREKKGA